MSDDNEIERAKALVEARQLLDAGLISELISETHRLAAGVESLADRLVVNTERINELTSLRNRNRTLGLVAAGLAFITAMAVAVSIGFGAYALHRLTNIAEVNRDNGRILIECTTPSPPAGQALDKQDRVHECYERGQEQQTTAVDSIGSTIVNAAICARSSGNEDEIIACVKRRQTESSNGK